jgi:tetratricopeptide (TPR) repeat protein
MASDAPMGAPASLSGARPATLPSEPVASDDDEEDVAAEPTVEDEDSGIETFGGRPTGASAAPPLAVDHDLETFPVRGGSGIPPLTQAVDDSDQEGESEEADEAAVADATPATIPNYAPLDAPGTAGAGSPVEGLEITASRHPVAAAAARADEPGPVAVPSEPEAAPALDARPTVTEIEGLLARAQDHFKSGEREQAGELLVEAALAYERIERLDNAASIFRSLARGAHATAKMLEHWLANCVRRGDAREAAEVACELGDRAVGVGQIEEAREWFHTALEQDPNNAISRRRLQRLGQVSPGGAALPTPVAPEPEPEPVAEVESGRVEMAVGRAEAVTFDLGSLLVEFQRGIEAQLSGDAQSHYDLAMTYWEMGLIEQAMDSFRLAAADAAFGSRAAEMIGRCLLDQGRYDEATSEFQIALQSPDLPADAAIGLRYHLGLALEAAGNLKDAVTEYERVFAQQANYSDVALKLRVLRKALEAA